MACWSRFRITGSASTRSRTRVSACWASKKGCVVSVAICASLPALAADRSFRYSFPFRDSGTRRARSRMIRIIVCDDHKVMRRGLRLVLEEQKDFEVIGEAGDGREAVNLAETHNPDVAVLDITMPNLNGIEAA